MQSILDPKWNVFMRIVVAGSVTRAALALDCPQSVVSRQLAQLEQQCGARLFRRTGRGVVLTDFGQQIHGRVQALMRLADDLQDEIDCSAGVPSGEVHVGLLPSTVGALARPIFAEVRRLLPRVRLHLVEGSSAELEEWLALGRLDLAMLLRDGGQAQGDEPVLARMALCLLGRAGDAVAERASVTLDEVLSLPLILPGAPHVLRSQLDKLASQRGTRLQLAIEADTVGLQIELAAAGAGYAVAAAVSAPGQIRRGELSAAPIVSPQLLRTVVLGTTAHRAHTLATRRVSELMRSIAAERLPAP
ncbi:LysR family transcriptional regulator [Rugamonas sp. A1-17]|nr:LysR family transcriptional regulator [Rugamonas sp. A1-17]